MKPKSSDYNFRLVPINVLIIISTSASDEGNKQFYFFKSGASTKASISIEVWTRCSKCWLLNVEMNCQGHIGRLGGIVWSINAYYLVIPKLYSQRRYHNPIFERQR